MVFGTEYKVRVFRIIESIVRISLDVKTINVYGLPLTKVSYFFIEFFG